MKMDLLYTSVVVLAKNHNPTILHPAFLSSQNIVPGDWEAEQPISTPVFSSVRYANGLVFVVEDTKFQLTNNEPADDPERCPVPDLATKYVRALPHVHYTAVGINVSGVIECPEPDTVLQKRFLKAGPWNKEPLRPQGFAVRFAYPVGEDVRLTLSLDGGKAVQANTQTERIGLLVNANYHTGVAAEGALEGTVAAIGKYAERRRHFETVVGKILALGD